MLDQLKTFTRDLITTMPFVCWSLLRLVNKQKPRQFPHYPIKGRVLVFATNALGDTVTVLPALQRVMQNQRPMKVDLLVRPKTAPLFKYVPGIGNVYTLEKLTFPFKVGALLANIRTLRQLRRRRYESALIFSSNFWTAWVAFLIAAKKRYGFSRTEKVGLATIRDFGFLLTHDKQRIKSQNYVEAHYEFLDWLNRGSNEPRALPQIRPSADARGLGKEIRKLANGKPIIVLNPFASQGIREWPLERWIELAQALAQHQVQVVFCCEGHQQKRLDAAFTDDRSKALVLSDLGLEDFVGLLDESTSVVTNDSGPLHLGYALGKPTVAIFGPTNPFNVIPNGAPVTVVRKQIECSPCVHLGSFERCPLTHHLCLNEITVDEVLTPLLAELRKTDLPVSANACFARG